VQCSAGGPPAGPTMRALQSAIGLVVLLPTTATQISGDRFFPAKRILPFVAA
jgi:hypothetical protein